MPAPRDHATTEAQFHAALWAPQTPEGLGQPDTRQRRFAVYRNNVQHGLTQALAARFPVIRRLLGETFFAAMARVFAAQYPPETPVLHEWGGSFPGFLDGFEPVRRLPYLSDVARLELARGRSYHAADAPRADPAQLAALKPETIRLTLAPSVAAFASRWPAVSIWAANQPGATPAALPPGPEYGLIGRTPACDVVVVPLDAPQHRILCALLAGASLAEAASDTDPSRLLVPLVRHGLIATLTGDPL
ncbi:MAG: DNA-binding domain-containing protein [Pararhodobacter sp.]